MLLPWADFLLPVCDVFGLAGSVTVGSVLRLAIFSIATVLAAGCGALDHAKPENVTADLTGLAVSAKVCTTAAAPASYSHVVWIVMENHRYGDVIGSAGAPVETAWAHACGSLTNYAKVGSPSLPNYIGATSGSTQGITDDASPTQHPLVVDNLFRQVRAAGLTERTYAEDMPVACGLVNGRTYGMKHNPALYYSSPSDRAACQADDLPMGTTTAGRLASDLANATMPSFAVMIPNLCNDTHDCSVATGDKWLAGWLRAITTSLTYTQGGTAVFVIWDEYTPMPNLVIAPAVRPGTAKSDRVDHFALLRTTEEMLGIPNHLGHAAEAPSLRPILGI